MAIVKVWIGDDLGENDAGAFEIREELERPFHVEVKTVEYQLSEDIECPPNTTP
jgi:hypothetical protein